MSTPPRTNRVTSRYSLLLLLLSALLLAACTPLVTGMESLLFLLLYGGTSSEMGPPPGTVQSAVRDHPLTSLLAAVPDTAANRAYVVLNDYAAWDSVTQSPAISQPFDLASLLTVDDGRWLRVRTTQMPSPGALGLESLRTENMVDWYGYNYFDALQSIEAGAPPDGLTVLSLRTPAERIETSLTASGYVAAAQAGGTLYSLREDYAIDFQSPTQIGRMATLNRIAVLEGGEAGTTSLLIGRATDPVLDGLAAAAGTLPSLADSASVHAAFSTLLLPGVAQDRALVSVIMVDGPQLADPLALLESGSEARRAQMERFAKRRIPAADLAAFATYRSAQSTFLSVAIVLPATADAGTTAATVAERMGSYVSTVTDRDFGALWTADASGGIDAGGTPVAWVTMRLLDEQIHRPGWIELIATRDLFFLAP